MFTKNHCTLTRTKVTSPKPSCTNRRLFNGLMLYYASLVPCTVTDLIRASRTYEKKERMHQTVTGNTAATLNASFKYTIEKNSPKTSLLRGSRNDRRNSLERGNDVLLLLVVDCADEQQFEYLQAEEKYGDVQVTHQLHDHLTNKQHRTGKKKGYVEKE